jgi:polyhydroxybutyrate depolymerase
MRRIIFALLACLLLIASMSPLYAQETETPTEPVAATPDESTVEAVEESTSEAASGTEEAPDTETTAEATTAIQLARGVNYPEPGSYTVQERFAIGPRQFRIYIPSGYPDAEAAGESVPLVIVMHGAGGNGAGMERITGFDQVAERETFIVVYPDGIDGGWGDGREPADPNDDVSYLEHVMDFVSDGFAIDQERIYATGYSMGGMMSYRLGCLLPGRIAAVASVASTFPEYQQPDCDPAPPVPVMMVLGTYDDVIPWDGRPGYFSTQESVEYWLAHNECVAKADIIEEFDIMPVDKLRARRETFNQCAEGSEVTLFGAVGGGHSWPGHPGVAELVPVLGGTSMDFDATFVIWEFFQRHPAESGGE